jgi:hypothetical protein
MDGWTDRGINKVEYKAKAVEVRCDILWVFNH